MSDFQKLLMRNIFWTKEERIPGSWKVMGEDELHNLYSSLNIIPVPKSGWNRRAQLTKLAGETTNNVHTRSLCEYLKEEHHLEDPDLDMGIIL
jgi:hypothetical protein